MIRSHPSHIKIRNVTWYAVRVVRLCNMMYPPLMSFVLNEE